MENFDRKKHWDNIYQHKQINEVSWYQPTPTTSLEFVKRVDLPKTLKIIDIGGGDSYFVDHLLNLGYTDITVLDISANAIEKAKQRLGSKAEQVKWVIADAATFEPNETYDFWHDRAAFHFLTDSKEIEHYVSIIKRYINPGGYFVVGTFSEQGPLKCSGIEIKQYSEAALTSLLNDCFDKEFCFTLDHKTPFNTVQNFIFCSFRRRETLKVL